MNNLNFIEQIDWGKIDKLTWVEDNTQLEKAHKYFCSVKCLSQEEFTLWKLLKHAMQSINSANQADPADPSAIRHWITIDTCLSKGLCDEIKGELVLAKYRDI